MFKKPLHDLKTSGKSHTQNTDPILTSNPAPLKSSERRKLRQRVVDSYQLDLASPGNLDIADVLVPEGILMAKFSTHHDDHGVSDLPR